MSTSEKYIFKYSGDRELFLSNPEGVFTPTGTTDALVKAAGSYLSIPGKLLDLGCGNGVAGLAMDQLGFVKKPLFASDLSKDAVEVTKNNAETYHCPVVAKIGSIFEPWQGEKFDCILNDISGVAKRVAEISPWFNSVPCESGEDGSELIVKMLNSAPDYLNEGGVLFFPVISLSNAEKIVEVATKKFLHVKRLSRDEWPFPKEMTLHEKLLEEMADNNIISFKKKFGLMIYYTDIYVAYN
jgi:methylase of polypeptide subunit release factors